MRTRFLLLPPAAALLLLATSCDNMRDQPHRTPLDPAPRPPLRRVAATVARGEPPGFGPLATGFADGAPVERSPLPFTRELLERGRDRFNIHCAVCHGADGHGAGIVVRRGFPAPASYHEPRLRDAPDGHLFDVITRGYGVMLPYADRLSPADRWAVVGYIRALQLGQHAPLAAVPAARREELLSP